MSISEHSAPIVLGESTISEVRRDIIGYYTMMNYKIFQKNISLWALRKKFTDKQ